MLVITMRVFNADMSSPQRQEQSSRQLVDTDSRKFNSYRPRRPRKSVNCVTDE